ncbi:hypothetical protein PS662_05024 [Pseudomonas fluorescens]|uniref:Uncharacterized protein n=1 Tax=Pseudomonas fluorescens TaxID=294 RepID=A0A5E6WYB2_PSEFL|nr:hypothetical protein PS662_05024 [Pseudomonas fluorescens]
MFQVMPRYLPIDTYDAETPVLFINTQKELSELSAWPSIASPWFAIWPTPSPA